MVFYKGGLQHSEKDIVSIPEIINLKNSCERINKELLNQQRKASK
jgi:hypothetical protein